MGGMSYLIAAIVSSFAFYLGTLGMSKWSARRTSLEESWWLLLWGNLCRLWALASLVLSVYLLVLAILAAVGVA